MTLGYIQPRCWQGENNSLQDRCVLKGCFMWCRRAADGPLCRASSWQPRSAASTSSTTSSGVLPCPGLAWAPDWRVKTQSPSLPCQMLQASPHMKSPGRLLGPASWTLLPHHVMLHIICHCSL